MSQLTKEQQAAQAKADAMGREYVTQIDGRIAIILRPGPEENVSDRLAKIARAIESPGAS